MRFTRLLPIYLIVLGVLLSAASPLAAQDIAALISKIQKQPAQDAAQLGNQLARLNEALDQHLRRSQSRDAQSALLSFADGGTLLDLLAKNPLSTALLHRTLEFYRLVLDSHDLLLQERLLGAALGTVRGSMQPVRAAWDKKRRVALVKVLAGLGQNDFLLGFAARYPDSAPLIDVVEQILPALIDEFAVDPAMQQTVSRLRTLQLRLLEDPDISWRITPQLRAHYERVEQRMAELREHFPLHSARRFQMIKQALYELPRRLGRASAEDFLRHPLEFDDTRSSKALDTKPSVFPTFWIDAVMTLPLSCITPAAVANIISAKWAATQPLGEQIWSVVESLAAAPRGVDQTRMRVAGAVWRALLDAATESNALGTTSASGSATKTNTIAADLAGRARLGLGTLLRFIGNIFAPLDDAQMRSSLQWLNQGAAMTSTAPHQTLLLLRGLAQLDTLPPAAGQRIDALLTEMLAVYSSVPAVDRTTHRIVLEASTTKRVVDEMVDFHGVARLVGGDRLRGQAAPLELTALAVWRTLNEDPIFIKVNHIMANRARLSWVEIHPFLRVTGR